MDDLDRRLINRLQRGLPLVRQPWRQVAEELHCRPTDVLDRLYDLLEDGVLTRMGPMFDIERLGGAFTLAALAVPEAQFEAVAAQLNALPQVAHNYRRDHRWNMWFVLACASQAELCATLSRIEALTGLAVLNLQKEHTYHVGLYLPV
jgi:DNA-binding Lrp family transcriptional regulator